MTRLGLSLETVRHGPLRPIHQLWRLFPTGARRWAHRQLLANVAVRPDPLPPPPRHGLVVAGELAQPSGLGESARILRTALRQMHVQTWSVDVGIPIAAPLGGRVKEDSGRPVPYGAPLLLHVNGHMVPWAFTRLGRRIIAGRRVIGYWAWELPLVPNSWRQALDFVHEVWAPSTFAADAFRAFVGSTIPVRVVRTPLAAVPPRPTQLSRAAFGLPDEAIVVLVSFSLASSFVRKNPVAAIRAFRSAFGQRRDRVLVLKIGFADQFPHDLAAIKAEIGEASNVIVETRAMQDGERHALTACADIVLSLHRSEGFGLVPAEAMLLGKAVVATGWSGNMEFMDATTAALVAPRLVEAHDPRGYFGGDGAVWADPDPEEAAVHLRGLADDPDRRKALGARAQRAVSERLGLASLQSAVRALGLAPAESPGS